MIKEDANNMSYKDYVIHPDYWYSFTFSYKGKNYQFDYEVRFHPEIDGQMPYCFYVYSSTDIDTNKVESCVWYKSFLDAINHVRIEGKSFEEIYNDPDSEIVDLN